MNAIAGTIMSILKGFGIGILVSVVVIGLMLTGIKGCSSLVVADESVRINSNDQTLDGVYESTTGIDGLPDTLDIYIHYPDVVSPISRCVEIDESLLYMKKRVEGYIEDDPTSADVFKGALDEINEALEVDCG